MLDPTAGYGLRRTLSIRVPADEQFHTAAHLDNSQGPAGMSLFNFSHCQIRLSLRKGIRVRVIYLEILFPTT